MEGIVICLLLILLFHEVSDGDGHRGVFEMTGAGVDTGGVDYGTYIDFKNYAAQGQFSKPAIVYDDSRVPTVGSCELADYISAYDFAGNTLQIEILSCVSPEGEALSPDTSVSATSFVMDEAGIYTIRAAAIDTGRRKSVCEIQIPVSEV